MGRGRSNNKLTGVCWESGRGGIMSVRIELECDGCGCSNSTEMDYYRDDHDIEAKGYFIDVTGVGHYCPKCTPSVKAELGIEGN